MVKKRNNKTTYSFFANYEPIIKNRIVMITGVTRSGTTLLGKIVSTLKNVEYEYEPSIVQHLSILENNNLINKDIASEMLSFNLNSMFIDHILGRNINLKTSDDSRKTLSKSYKEIKRRWIIIKNQQQAEEYIKQNNSLFVFKSTNMYQFLPFLFNALEGIKIINIIRDVSDVVLSMKKKRWYENDYLQNVSMQIMRKKFKLNNKNYYVPEWVEDDDIYKFIKYKGYDRYLFCWNNFIDILLKFKSNNFFNKKNYIEIKYEDLIISPTKIVVDLELFLKTKRTRKTKGVLDDINSKNKGKNKNFLETNKIERDKAIKNMLKLGY